MTNMDGTLNFSKTLDNERAESTIDHDALLNYEANEHINWTSATENLTTTGNIQANSFMTKGSSAGTFVGFQKSGDDAELTFATDTNSDGVANYVVDVVMPQSSASGFWGWVERTNTLTSPLLSYTFTTQILQFIGKGGIRISSGSSTAGTLINNFIGTTASSIISAPTSISPNSVNTRVQVTDTLTTISNVLRYTGSTPAAGARLQSDGSGDASWVAPEVVSVVGSSTTLTNQTWVRVSTQNGVDVTLPLISTVGIGRRIRIINDYATSTNALLTASGNTFAVGGGTSTLLTQGRETCFIVVASSSTEWETLNFSLV